MEKFLDNNIIEKMTSRERVLRAVDHKEPDRVPISFGGSMSTGILECPPDGLGYSKLCKYLGIENYAKPDMGFVFNIVNNIDKRILDKFGSDFIQINSNPPEIKIEKDGTKTILGIFCGMRVKKIGYYDDVFEFPLRDLKNTKDIKSYPYWPTKTDFVKLREEKEAEVKSMRKNTDKAIVAETLLAFPFLMYPLLSGYDKWFLDMKINQKFYFSLADKLLEIAFGIIDNFICAVGNHIDIVATYDDMGSQEGLFCSRADYLKFINPYERQIINRIKIFTDAKIYRHSCGSVFEIIPDFIEMGVDILNPVQPLAKNMEPWRLKNTYGKDLTFFGGFDIQKLLPLGAVKEVEEGVKKLISTYGSNGGYIFGPSHNIEPDTPPENILAMYESAQKYGGYPLVS